MRDEDLLRKARADGRVAIGGKEFSIKPVDAGTLLARSAKLAYETEHSGNFSSPVQRNDPATFPELYLPQERPKKPYQRDDRPEVALREGIRAAIRGGISSEKSRRSSSTNWYLE